MKKIVFISLQKDVIDELVTYSRLDYDMDYELHCFDTLENIEQKVETLHPDLIVLSFDALIEKEVWQFGSIPIAFHARTRQELQEGARYGFPTVGVAMSPLDIKDILNKHPYKVNVDGKEIPHFLHRRKFEETDCGWYYSQTLKSVLVKYPNPKKDYQVVVSFEQFDLIGM